VSFTLLWLQALFLLLEVHQCLEPLSNETTVYLSGGSAFIALLFGIYAKFFVKLYGNLLTKEVFKYSIFLSL
jgi:hypothetical protein